MTKAATEATIPPELFATQAHVLAGECVQVVEQLNWTASKPTQCHFSATCGGGSWAGGSEGPALGLIFAADSRLCLELTAVANAEVASFVLGARVVLSTGKEGKVVFELREYPGGIGDPVIDWVELDFTDSDNGSELTAVSDLGGYSGPIKVYVTIEMTTGTPADEDMLYSVRVEDAQLASLPDPPDE